MKQKQLVSFFVTKCPTGKRGLRPGARYRALAAWEPTDEELLKLTEEGVSRKRLGPSVKRRKPKRDTYHEMIKYRARLNLRNHNR